MAPRSVKRHGNTQQQTKISNAFTQQTRAKAAVTTRTRDEIKEKRKVDENETIDEQQLLQPRLNTQDPELVNKAASILDARIIAPGKWERELGGGIY